MNNCGISRWDDPNEINARLKALTSQPIWELSLIHISEPTRP